MEFDSIKQILLKGICNFSWTVLKKDSIGFTDFGLKLSQIATIIVHFIQENQSQKNDLCEIWNLFFTLKLKIISTVRN